MNERLRRMIEAGASIIGSSTSAAISVLSGVPELSIGSAALGSSGVYQRIGSEISNRMLGPREQARVGGVLALSAEVLKSKLDEGHRLRDDGFFDDVDTGKRSDAEEVLEGVLRKAQTEYEERKLEYYGRFWANVCIVKDMELGDINYLMNLAEQLTYRHLTIISMLGKIVGANRTGIEDVTYPPHSYATDKEFVESGSSEIPTSLIADISYLADLHCVSFPRERNPNYYVPRPPHIERGFHGISLDELMELYRIPESDRIPLATLLRWPLEWKFGDARLEKHTPSPMIHRVRVQI